MAQLCICDEQKLSRQTSMQHLLEWINQQQSPHHSHASTSLALVARQGLTLQSTSRPLDRLPQSSRLQWPAQRTGRVVDCIKSASYETQLLASGVYRSSLQLGELAGLWGRPRKQRSSGFIGSGIISGRCDIAASSRRTMLRMALECIAGVTDSLQFSRLQCCVQRIPC